MTRFLRNLLGAVLSSFVATAGAGGLESRAQFEVINGFAHYERAWAAYQLTATVAKYDAGDLVVAAPGPNNISDLFQTYVLRPGAATGLNWFIRHNSGTSVDICVGATIKSPNQLSGFIQGLEQQKASFATTDCVPANLNKAIAYPAQVFAYKTVNATKAAYVIALDTAERQAQQAVAGTIQFQLPAGRLLDFTAPQGQSSGISSATLSNTSGGSWNIVGAPEVVGPFSAQISNCTLLLPGDSCTLNVSFVPTQRGKFYGYITVRTDTGVPLTIRVLGKST